MRVPVSGYAVVRDRSDREAGGRISNWARDYLHRVAVVDLGCATAGVLAAAQIRFGNDVARTYLALSLALPLLWVTALWMADSRGMTARMNVSTKAGNRALRGVSSRSREEGRRLSVSRSGIGESN
jgi:hypothetical protein